MYLSLHVNALAEYGHRLVSVHNGSSKGAFTLIPYKYYTGFRIPQIMLQMVLDSPRLAHAAGRYNDLGFRVHVQGF